MGVSVGSELFVLRKLESVLFADIDCYHMLYLGMFSHNWGGRFHKGWILGLCVALSFSGLFVYKYLNFFNESIFRLLNLCGLRIAIPKFDLLLPIGISFYTFMAVGYLIDVYKGKINPEKNLAKYVLFVSFFLSTNSCGTYRKGG